MTFRSIRAPAATEHYFFFLALYFILLTERSILGPSLRNHEITTLIIAEGPRLSSRPGGYRLLMHTTIVTSAC